MKIVRKCLNCGNEYESTDRKNASLYCGKECKDSHVANNVKEIFESVTEGLGQAVEMEELNRLRAENEELKAKLEKAESEELEPTLEEIEAKFKDREDLTNKLIEAIHLLKEHSAKSKDIQHLYNRQSHLDRLRTDHYHLLSLGKVRTKQERDSFFIQETECLVERRIVKAEIDLYQNLRLLEGFTRMDFSVLVPSDKKSYKPRVLDCGTIKSDSDVQISELGEKPKSIDEITTSDYEEYVQAINSLPLTSKMIAKTVNFSAKNREDLICKINQMRASKLAPKSFRVEGNLLKCYV